MLAALKRNGLAENTLVMFSSDNGPVVDDGYRDQAVEKLGGHKPAGIYRGGKYSNFDGGTRVPFMVRWPGHVKPDSTSDAMFSQLDMFASLAGLAGVKGLRTNAAPDSFNQLPALLGTLEKGQAVCDRACRRAFHSSGRVEIYFSEQGTQDEQEHEH